MACERVILLPNQKMVRSHRKNPPGLPNQEFPHV